MACGRFVLSWFSVIYCTRCTCSIEPKGQILYEDFQGLTFRHSKPCSKRFPGAVNKSCEVANGMTIDKRVEGGFSVIPPTPYKFLEPVPTSDEKRALVKQTKRRGRGGARARQGEARRGGSMESTSRSWSIESYLHEHFDIPAKNPSGEARLRWRRAVGLVVRNRRRRFRMFSALHSLDDDQRRKILVRAPILPSSPLLCCSQSAVCCVSCRDGDRLHRCSRAGWPLGTNRSIVPSFSLNCCHITSVRSMDGGVWMALLKRWPWPLGSGNCLETSSRRGFGHPRSLLVPPMGSP
jgi:hypothetical protein